MRAVAGRGSFKGDPYGFVMRDGTPQIEREVAAGGRRPVEVAAPVGGGPKPARIAVLSPLVASQIAAGEVVERPASVVKELVENSVDAGAMRIEIELEQGGIELIRITDDGCGIEAEDLALAYAPHATSKVKSAAELERIPTLGFRGEAVASIASVSRMSIRSRTVMQESAFELESEGDVLGKVRPAAGARGTTVTVRNLFFNTPARRKFLRTIPTEYGRCLEAVENAAMAHPAIGFTLKHDGRVTLDVPPGQGPRDRLVAVLGKELASELLECSADEMDAGRGMTMFGLVGKPSIARGSNKAQHIFVNGRPVRDRTIMHAIAEAFRGLIEPGRYPTAAILIEMDPAMVDVNVHPQKAEVRFRDGSRVHQAVLHAVRAALAKEDLTPRAESMVERLSGLAQRPMWGADAARAILPAQVPGQSSPFAASSAMPSEAAVEQDRKRFAEYFSQQAHSSGATQGRMNYGQMQEALGAGGASDIEPAAYLAAHAERELVMPPAPSQQVLQVHKSFLVTQDEAGVLIVDQHALHERVMFEFLMQRVMKEDAGLESQRLLVPVVVDATEVQVERLGTLAPLLNKLGMELSAIGPRTVAVQAMATFLIEKGVDAGEVARELLEKAESEQGWQSLKMASEEVVRDIVNMMACKAAVKAGDAMSQTELADLLSLREAVDRSSNCPHGRPTTIRLTIKDLEKLFGRT
jgi:DNA mismatch repair protein MutL